MSLGTVISLCDRSGNMVRPWLEAGYDAITVDLQEQINPHPRRRHIIQDVTDINPEIAVNEGAVAVFAFPPCTDTAVSGARWFKDKGLDGLIGALKVVSACKNIGGLSRAPWMLENPVSTIATYWRKPDHTFHPWQYTGWCTEDHYTKKTCLWTGGGFVMPETFVKLDFDGEPDDRIHKAAPGPERANFRSATPMGFARAVYLANAPHLRPAPAELCSASSQDRGAQ
jgi:hypothetical protein